MVAHQTSTNKRPKSDKRQPTFLGKRSEISAVFFSFNFLQYYLIHSPSTALYERTIGRNLTTRIRTRTSHRIFPSGFSFRSAVREARRALMLDRCRLRLAQQSNEADKIDSDESNCRDFIRFTPFSVPFIFFSIRADGL